MWLVIELWPHPAHSVVAAPLYASRGRPMWLMVALIRGPREIEEFVGFSRGDGLRFEKWFCDGVGRDGLAVVVADGAQALDERRRQGEAEGGVDLAGPVRLDDVHALVPGDEVDAPRGQRQGADA